MAVYVDLEARTIQASIRDLAEGLRESTPGLGLLGRVRAELGSRVHREYRQRQGERPGFSGEVAVKLALEVDGFAATVRGRIDGLIGGPEGTTIEEVKSVALGESELARVQADSFPDYTLQVRLYALAYAGEHPGTKLSARLVLVSLLDSSFRELPVALYPASTLARLIDLLRQAVEQARADRARAERLAALAERLKFPYPAPRPHQAQFMAALTAGLSSGRPVLAMAPTGIGKTVGALLSCLRHALRHNAPLLYLTSKTTQQHLVEQTFEEIGVASGLKPDELRCLTIRNKESMCPPGTLTCHPELCPLLEDLMARLGSSRAIAQLLEGGPRLDPDAIRAVGEAHRLCPFALSLLLIPAAQVVVCDYNYAYDPGLALGEFFGEGARRPVVVVDEAHNLFDRARGYYSPFLSRHSIQELDQRIERGEFMGQDDAAGQLLLSRMSCSVDGPALFARLRALLDDLDQAIREIQQTAERQELPAVEDCRVIEPDREAWGALAQEAAETLFSYAFYNRAHAITRRDDPVLELLTTVVRIRDVLSLPGPEFVPYTTGAGAPGGHGFGCLCVNPARRLTERHRLSAGTAAISATLTPLPYFADVLGFAPLDPVTVSMPSPFPRENLGVFVVPSVSTTFRERGRHRRDVAAIIEQTVQAHPGRYAAYFPSFQYLGDVRAEFDLAADQIMVQLPGMPEAARQRLLTQFRGSADPKLLLAVMGGVFAEGIDLPGSELIGAVVVGLGLPQVGFERAAMQQYFESEYEQGFAYAMLYPGMQRVIQSAGRVIRTPEDVGVIVLADRRFAEPDVARCFPEHWVRYDPSELITEDLPGSLRTFWAYHGA